MPKLTKITFDELTHSVAIFAVPLGPQDGEIADLISSGTKVPGLSNELGLLNYRILLNDIEEGGKIVDVVQLTSQGAGQVESEPVDVHFLNPIAQRVHN